MSTLPPDDIGLASQTQTTARRDALGARAPNRADPERWRAKAEAYRMGWRQHVGAEPTLPNVILGLAVAEHETWCGDAWAGEHNWGACQKRILSVAEKAVLTSNWGSASGTPIVCRPENVAAARAALADATARGKIAIGDHEALHVDSSPGKGWYWVFFWAFPDDVEGAAFFVNVLVGKHLATRQMLTNAAVANATSAYQLAALMYAAGYYEGFHEKHKTYPQKDGSTKTGAELNITDYANSLIALIPSIAKGLSGQAPPAPSPTIYDLTTVAGWQAALVALAHAHPEFDPGKVDGILGPKTKSALVAFQRASGLTPDGICGPVTRAAFKAALAKL